MENYNRPDAIACIQELINRYSNEINQLGFIIDGFHNVDFSTLNDFQIRDQLIYIGQRIPIYAFIREGEKQVVDYLLNEIGFFGFNKRR